MSYVAWLVIGTIFSALELVLPGGVSGALGLATLMIAMLIYIGYLTTYPIAFALWLLLSTVFLLVVRTVMRRLSPNQTSVGRADHDESLFGTSVNVTETILPGSAGRITVGGTSWLAVLNDPDATAPTGSPVRLVSKNNITWLVELNPQITAGEDS